ncbi:MAG: DNA mismatch repair endonuclease MutL [Syntrophaceae bacterium]|nr:DNA mismatch repair endonuclease MutL [Syntrophaceae bacterium]
MSKRIVVLPADIASKIAAGEVVERPASIVKELMENSIDAGAKSISIELERGGCESIKIIDDGSGIDTQDVALVFERHATSKISKFEDIYQVSSFGFRGEAMPSIASVARVELLTRLKGSKEGTKAIVEAGNVKEITPAGCPEGTQIFISNIFAHIPARKKFLKKEATEQSLCMDTITRLALAHPEIRFRAQVNSKEIFAAPKTDAFNQRIAAVMGMDFSASCIPVSGEKEDIKLTGFISHPEFTRSNSKNIYFYVNKRFIRDNSLIHAVLSAYRQIIPPRRYPAGVFFIELPTQDVDVNVHPAKLEVRFKNSRDVYDLVSQAIARQLAQAASTKEGSFVYRLTPRKDESSVNPARIHQSYADKPASLFRGQMFAREIFKDASIIAEAKMTIEAQNAGKQDGKQITFSGLNYLGQFAGTYLVFSGEDGMLLIDQHAAHERIILERLKETGQQKISSQQLLMPEIVSLPPQEIALFAGYLELLTQIGLEAEVFGKDALAIKAMPAILTGAQAKEIIMDIADKLKDQNQSSSLQGKKEEIYASLACHAAIKANQILSFDEVAKLCRDLENTPFNTTCPHGRPISIKFSLSEVERMFKRK